MTAFGSAGSRPSACRMRLPALPSKSRNAASYDASDPQSIDKVFTAVISNF
jgi:hypothetical protein